MVIFEPSFLGGFFMEKVLINGALRSLSDTDQVATNRGLLYGDSLFETMRYSGGKLYFWEDHYFRLMASMRIMRMEIPMDFTPEFLEGKVQEVIAANELRSAAARVRMTVWRKAGGRYTPTTNDIGYLIRVEELEDPFYTLPGVYAEVELYKDHYLNSGLLSTVKSNNRLINVLGSIFAKENDYDNCLLLNEKKQVVEALNGNIFLVNGYKIKTPPVSEGCLNGVMRKKVIEILAEMPDYILDESPVSPFELQKKDEIFITNVIGGIMPVKKYRKKEFSDDVARELLPKINVKARLG
jgi:branched-chain amino acid aminotransferase